MEKNIIFFIGTEAEFIKVFPVIIECQQAGSICNIIASGQNDLRKSRILEYIRLNGRYVELSKESDIKKTARGLLGWYIKTKKDAVVKIRKAFEDVQLKDVYWVIHGDTVSTLMGAEIGKKLGCKVCHVEAGLRSHNFLNPFPEEIDRVIASRKASVHFAPGKDAVENLKKAKGLVINTEYNTILDSLNASKEMPILTDAVASLVNSAETEEYFVFVMHRQENLADSTFVKNVLEQIKENVTSKKCVLILHKITELKLKDLNELESLKKDPRFILLPRVDYFDFMKLLYSAKYVITDGGSNQEELFYMGKPTLIMRKTTERSEGIGQNAVLYGGNIELISRFGENYLDYEIDINEVKMSPSVVIRECLMG